MIAEKRNHTFISSRATVVGLETVTCEVLSLHKGFCFADAKTATPSAMAFFCTVTTVILCE